MTKRRRAASILLSLAMTACVQIEKYPETWEGLTLERGTVSCPAVSGVYDNNGTKPDGTKVSLAAWLSDATGRTRQEDGQSARNHFLGELFKTHVVELKLVQDSELTIHAKGAEFGIAWRISKNDRRFECKDGALVIFSGGNASGDNVVAFSTGSMKLYPTNSHLTLNSSGWTAGIMLLVPMAAYEDNWARFPRVQ